MKILSSRSGGRHDVIMKEGLMFADVRVAVFSLVSVSDQERRFILL